MTRIIPEHSHSSGKVGHQPNPRKIYKVCINQPMGLPYRWQIIEARYERGKWYPINKPDWMEVYFLWNQLSDVMWYEPKMDYKKIRREEYLKLKEQEEKNHD